MRIDHKGITPGTTSLGSTERTEAEKRTDKAAGASRGADDSVQLSSDAHLLHQALRAAADLPSTRADRVAAVKQKLAAGEIGNDAGRLADRLIDNLLER